MVKKIAGWVCVLGSVGVLVSLIYFGATGQIHDRYLYFKAGWVIPVALLYGLKLLRSDPKETPV